jgi:hypothetical protein
MGLLFSFSQIIGCSAIYYGFAVQEKMLEYLFKIKYLGSAVYNTEKNHPEASLQRRHLIKLVQNNIGNLIFFQIKSDPHTAPVRFIADLGDRVNFFVPD